MGEKNLGRTTREYAHSPSREVPAVIGNVGSTVERMTQFAFSTIATKGYRNALFRRGLLSLIVFTMGLSW